MSTSKPLKKSHSLRLPVEKGRNITEWARESRRSFSAEVELLIDQGIAWRKEHGNTVPQPQEGQ